MRLDSGAVGLQWRVRERPDYTHVEFSGDLDENANLAGLLSRLSGVVVFSLAGIGRINSAGIREWIEFLRDLRPRVGELIFTHCSTPFVVQLNSIYNFRGSARIESFFAPYVCKKCGTEEAKLLLARDLATQREVRVPDFSCDECGYNMDLDEVAERFFSFLREGRESV